MAYSVGSASVDIVPSAKGFQAKLDAQLRGVTAKVDVALKDAGVRQQLEAISRGVTATVRVDLDDAGARTKLDALTRRRSATVNVDADTGGAEAKLAGLGSAASGAGGSISALLIAGAALAPAIVPAAAAATGALLGIGAASLVGAAGVGVLVLGLAGVVSAVSATTKAQAGAAQEAATAAAAQVAAAERIRSAQVGVKSAEASLANARAASADAARRSAQAVQQAQQGVRAATQQAAQAVAQAVAQEATAERSLRAALQQEVDAQKALSDARQQAKRDIEDLTNSVADGALAQRQAAIDVENAKAALDKLGPTQIQIEQAITRTALAQERYTKLLANPKATQAQRDAARVAVEAAKSQQLALEQSVGGSDLQRRQAQLDYEQALQHQKELATSQQRLTEQQKAAQAAGVNGAPGVVSAQQNVAQAHQGVADAHQGVADAQKAVVHARIDGAQRIQNAERALADATAARATQERQSQYSIAQAQQQVANSQRSLAAAYAKTGTTAATATDKARDALAKLTPEGRKLAAFIVGTIIPGFKHLGDLAQGPISRGLLAGFQAAAPLFPVIERLVVKLGDAMGKLLESAGKALGSPFWVDFFRMLGSIAGPVIHNLGTIIGNLVTGFAGMLQTFAPVGKSIGDALLNVSKHFKDFGTGKTTGLGRFFDYVTQVGPLVAGMFGSLFRAVGHIMVALAPFGTTVVGWIKTFADWISRIPVDTLRQVAGQVAAVVLAVKGLSVGASIVGALGPAFTLLANPVGLVVLAVGALVTIVGVVLWHSQRFRDFVTKELLPALGNAAAMVKAGLTAALHGLWGFIDQKVIPVVIYLARTALAGARDAFNIVRAAVERNRPQLEKLWSAFKKVADFVVQKIIPLLGPVLQAQFRWLGTTIGIAIDVIGGIIDVFTNVHDAALRLLGAKGTLRKIFTDGVAAIGRIWDGLKAVAKAPIKFVIDTVLNKGLIPAYNWVAGILPGVGPIKPIPLPKGFAAGTSNVLPGYTPGADVHRFYSPTGGILDLSGGEGIARPELVREIGPARWDAANAAAASGRVGDGLRYLGGFAQGASRVWPTNTHKLSGNYAGHSGVDIAAGYGAPIYAAAPGTISYTGWGHGYGQAIFEKIAGSMLSIVYGHTSKLLTRSGQHVNAGQLIGRVGATGHATGPHLHFEINSPGPFGNAADRSRSLAWLNGATVNGGGGIVGDGGGGLVDWIGKLKDKFAGPLGKLKALESSPWGKLVAAAPRALASGMIANAKHFVADAAGNVVSGIGNVVAAGSNRARGQILLAAAGFNPLTQWGPLNKLWTRESGWRTTATNPTSGAYGIPQALPASKMASAGGDWRTNPNTQIKWGLGYIKDRYGSPSNAWAHELRSGWYDNGGWLQPGTTIVHNNTGRPEPVFTGSQFDQLVAGRGGRALTAAGDVYVGYDPGELFDEWDRRDRRAAVRHNLTPV
jgi:hypothetical protein